jgi:hypothetical protein
MTTKKKPQSPAKGKAGSKAQGAALKRAHAIVADEKGFSRATRRALRRALETHAGYIAELVKRADAGEDVMPPIDHAPELVIPAEAEADAFKARAVAYARSAFDAALGHFESHHADPFALSRLAVVYGETKPGDVHMVVTLPGAVNKNVTEAEAYEAVKDAELLARTLEHEGCGEAFTKAFGVIYTEHILDGSDVSWTTPTVVRVMLPLLLLEQWSRHDGAGLTPRDILITLSNELVSEEVATAVRASLGM